MFKVSDEIRDQLKKLPAFPGVYMMKDAYDKIIYVGKAKNLKNRVCSYFTAVESHPNKTKNLVVNTVTFDYIITKTEEEALILEANLIKDKKPKFNVMLKDDKSYPYICITKEEFPKVYKTRNTKERGTYYGPYTSVYSVNKFIDVIGDIYPGIRCDYSLKNIKQLDMYYKLIDVSYSKEEYNKYIGEIVSFLKGNDIGLKDKLIKKREEYSRNLEFEKAIEVRDKLIALDELKIYQKVSSLSGDDKDYIFIGSRKDYICASIFIYRDGKMIERENHIMKYAIEKDLSEVLESFILQYYAESTFIPNSIYVSHMVSSEVIHAIRTIGKKKVNIIHPKQGSHKKILTMLEENTKEYLNKFYDRIEKEEQKKEDINLILSSIVMRDQVDRIEAFDISNIFGYLSVGSMVVFEKTKKKPTDYRMFKIKHVKGPDDYSSMREVLMRRMNRLKEKRFGKAPDIIILDGGKGHVSVGLDVINEYSLNVPVLGLIKDEKHRTKSLYFNGREMELEKGTSIYNFFYQIQEEMHRFAISYHKTLRGKSLIHSILDDIDGIGAKRKTELLKHFTSIDNIRNATVEELQKVDKMDGKSAKNVYDYFRKR